MLIEVATGAVAASAGALAYGVRHPRSSLVAPSVWHGTASRRSIALTFDDGPSESTLRVLDLLDCFAIQATFFQCGANVRRLPRVCRQVAEEGHEIGNHTDTHPFLHLRSAAFIRGQIESAQKSIEGASGRTPVLFRAPYGVRWFGLGQAQREFGLTGVTWSAIATDWKRRPANVARRILEAASPGAILCLHDGRELRPDPDISVTLEALRLAIPCWIDRGLQFETVSQILCLTN
jgi:peptidoglycan/xylan/chitin deacetylase (PgdA/CDA1 family)